MTFFENQKFDLELIKTKFRAGDYDGHVYVNPMLTKELKFLIENDNDFFADFLFHKCKSVDVLDFWFSNHVKLPFKPLAVAIVMKSPITTFEYLAKIGELKPLLAPYEREDFRIRAKTKLEPFVIDYVLNYKLNTPTMDN